MFEDRYIKEDNPSLRMGLMGDVMIGRLVNEQLDHLPHDYIWGNLLPILKSNDINLINLEAALTKSDKIVPKVFNFKADTYKVQSLVDAHIHVANLANNHVLDYSVEGLYETLLTLDHAQIQHVGAGKNLAEASQPVVITRKGMTIGFLGCSDNEPTWKATKTKPGIKFLEVGDIEAIREDILALRQKVDILILTIHWGPNMRERPPQIFKKFAHNLMDLGVDLIHGHSAHIFQGVEIYKGKVILYDTGDFIDDYYVDPFLRNDHSFLFLAECQEKKIQRLRLIPVLISNFQVNLASENASRAIMQRMNDLSREMGTKFEQEENTLILNFHSI